MHPEPILVIGSLEIYLYGLFIAIGLVACLIVYHIYVNKKKMPQAVQDFTYVVIFIAIVIGFLFAALFQAVYGWIETGVFEFGGITAMGGFIGGAAAFILAYFVGGKLYFKGKRANIDYKGQFNTLVLVAPCCITLAHAFGRIGCLMAGCCHGKFSETPVSGYIYMDGGNGLGYYIPTQLYEAIFLFILFAVLSYLYFKRSNIIMQVYLAAYAVFRFIIEFFRGDEIRGQFLGIYFSQWQSFAFLAGAIALFIVYWKKGWPWVLPKPKADEPPKEETVETVAEENTEK